MDLYDTVYHACAAKFASEVASDVGNITFMKIIQRDRQNISFSHSLEEELKKIWKANKPIVPFDAIELIKNRITPAQNGAGHDGSGLPKIGEGNDSTNASATNETETE